MAPVRPAKNMLHSASTELAGAAAPEDAPPPLPGCAGAGTAPANGLLPTVGSEPPPEPAVPYVGRLGMGAEANGLLALAGPPAAAGADAAAGMPWYDGGCAAAPPNGAPPYTGGCC